MRSVKALIGWHLLVSGLTLAVAVVIISALLLHRIYFEDPYPPPIQADLLILGSPFLIVFGIFLATAGLGWVMGSPRASDPSHVRNSIRSRRRRALIVAAAASLLSTGYLIFLAPVRTLLRGWVPRDADGSSVEHYEMQKRAFAAARKVHIVVEERVYRYDGVSGAFVPGQVILRYRCEPELADDMFQWTC